MGWAANLRSGNIGAGMILKSIFGFLSVCLLTVGCASVTSVVGSTSGLCQTNSNTQNRYFGDRYSDHLVVFIHGLCGDATETWVNKETQFYFPQELAKDFNDTFIISFNYTSQLQGSPSILSITDYLEVEISKLLKLHPYRTIRFVTHSMGGIIAREYILRRLLHAHPQLRVTNVVLLATPSNGSELAMFKWLVPENRQVEELRHIDKGNTYLESLNKDWNRQFKSEGHSRHLLLYAGYEELTTSVMGKVVTLSSAVAFADEYTGFPKDHFDMAKPKNREDNLYSWVKAAFKDSLEARARQYVQESIRKRLLDPADSSKMIPHITDLYQQLQDLTKTELKDVPGYIKEKRFEEALSLLSKSESEENQIVGKIAHTRYVKAQVHELLFQKTEARDNYEQSVRLAPENPIFHRGFGTFLLLTGSPRQALPHFDETIRLAQGEGDAYGEAIGLFFLGESYFVLGESYKSIEYLKQALTIFRRTNELKLEGWVLGSLGTAYSTLGKFNESVDLLEQALAISRKRGDLEGEGFALLGLGQLNLQMGDFSKAIELFEQSFSILRKFGDERNEGVNISTLGLRHLLGFRYTLDNSSEAIASFEKELAISRKIGNLYGEGINLSLLGFLYTGLNQPAKAIEFLDPALAIFQKIGDTRMEGIILCNLGKAYSFLGRHAEAIDVIEKGLAISRKIGFLSGEFEALFSLSIAYIRMNQPSKAREFSEQLLEISHRTGNKFYEGLALLSLGETFGKLKMSSKAIESYEQALHIFSKIGILYFEEMTLDSLGSEYSKAGKHSESIPFYEQALEISRKIGDQRSEASALASLGEAYVLSNAPSKAIEMSEQARVLSHQIGDQRTEAEALVSLGHAYVLSNEPSKAVEISEQARVLSHQIKALPHEVLALMILARAFEQLGEKQKSILHCKQANELIENLMELKRSQVRCPGEG